MPCTIETNQNGVVKVLAENGRNSQLYKSILKQPFVESEEDALTYYEAALKYKGEDFYSDSNGEPILMFASQSPINQLALPNKVVYTSSYKEALEQDKSNRGVEVGFLRKSKPSEITAQNDIQFFKDLRNKALKSKSQVSGISPSGNLIVADPSSNNFKPITKVNKQASERSLSGFINDLITGNFIQPEKIPATKLNEEGTTIDFKVFDMGKGDISVLAVNEYNEKIGFLRLFENEQRNLQVDKVRVEEDYRGYGIGRELYFVAREQLGQDIYSDRYQTEDAQGLWESLVRDGFAERMVRDIKAPNENYVRLYRGETSNDVDTPLPTWVSEAISSRPQGNFFTLSLDEATYYNSEFGVGDMRVSYIDVLKKDLENYRASNNEGQQFSARGMAENEFFLPPQLSSQRKLLPINYKLTSYPQQPTIEKTPEQTVSELIKSGEIEAHCKL